MPVASNAVSEDERYERAREQAAIKHGVKYRLVELFDEGREEADRDE
jgi:hypothetical protein